MTLRLTKRAIDLGIVTTNGPAMLAFYRDVLELKYLREMPMPIGGGVMHQLACGDSIIKLVVLDSTPDKAPPGGIAGATGIRYWTITVDDVAAMLQHCADAGHPAIGKPKEIRPGVKIGIVADPDGNWVEFLSLAPKPL